MTSRKQKEKNGKSSRSASSLVGPASKTRTVVGRAVLQNLTTATLYKLLKLKNVPLRSKLRKKEDRVEALVGIVTVENLEDIGIKTDGIVAGQSIHPEARALDKSRKNPKITRGKRFDTPVAGIDVHSHNLVVAIATNEGIT
ncbi:MAG: hypothetical protein ACTSUE_02185 [Promethearchaeota archaeon]